MSEAIKGVWSGVMMDAQGFQAQATLSLEASDAEVKGRGCQSKEHDFICQGGVGHGKRQEAEDQCQDQQQPVLL